MRASCARCSPACRSTRRAARRVHAALAAKDAGELRELTRELSDAARATACWPCSALYGDDEVLDEARDALPRAPRSHAALADLRLAGRHARDGASGGRVGFDLADLRGYAYYSGARFAVYAAGASDALARGGRYDEVGAVFGRNRPAVGFSLDLRELVGAGRRQPRRAPRSARRGATDAALRARHRRAARARRDRGLRAARPRARRRGVRLRPRAGRSAAATGSCARC